MARTDSWIKTHLPEIIFGAVALPALGYAVTSAYKSEQQLAAQTAELDAIHEDLRTIKQTFVAVLLDNKPDKTKIIERLVGDSNVMQGARLFEQGAYQEAYAIWLPAAKNGNSDSVLALKVATDALKARMDDSKLSENERGRARAALSVVAADLKQVQSIWNAQADNSAEASQRDQDSEQL